MFLATDFFNGDISEWDVSSVKDMSQSQMFYHSTSFNPNQYGIRHHDEC